MEKNYVLPCNNAEWNRPFPSLFEQIAKQYENNNALAFATSDDFKTLSYRSYKSLNERTNRLAHYLMRDSELGPGKLVGIFVSDMASFIECLLAVWKTGAAYVPISLTEERNVIKEIITNSKPNLFLTDKPLASNLASDITLPLIITNELETNPNYQACSKENPPTVSKIMPNDLAYVMYTSGSTGKPKGAEISHRGIPYTLKAHQDTLELNPSDRIAQLARVGFDASLMEILMALGSGACLYIVPSAVQADALKFTEYFYKHEISQAIVVPSRLQTLESPEKFPKLLGLIVTGEAFEEALIQPWFEAGIILVDGYGLTETTICTTLGKYTGNGLSAGTAIIGTHLYIVEPHEGELAPGTVLEPLPLNENKPIVGELYIAGMSVALRYRNDKNLTKQRFIKIKDPKTETGEHMRAYRSGDICELSPNGEIKIIGRVDNQLKLRGQRLEPEHIEAKLLEYKLNGKQVLQNACVVGVKINQDQHLVAYVVLASNLDITVSLEQIRDYLKQHLPGFMIPNAWAFKDDLPLTKNGKIDRRDLANLRTLPFLKIQQGTKPKTGIEKTLAKTWEEILECDAQSICREDDFLSLGGSSIKITPLLKMLQKNFHANSLKDTDIYNNSTLQCMAALCSPSSLKLLAEHATHSRVYFIHSLLGDGWSEYQQLINLIPFQCYGFRARGLDDIDDYEENLIDLAKAYVKELIKSLVSADISNQETPLILVGWSSGGTIALEMARQLKAQNYKNIKIILLDAGLPRSYEEGDVIKLGRILAEQLLGQSLTETEFKQKYLEHIVHISNQPTKDPLWQKLTAVFDYLNDLDKQKSTKKSKELAFAKWLWWAEHCYGQEWQSDGAELENVKYIFASDSHVKKEDKKFESVQKTVSKPEYNLLDTNKTQADNVFVHSETTFSVELNNLATQAFLGDGGVSNPSHLKFRTWYHPDICHYLLQLVPNQAKCIRVIFYDAVYGNNTKTFKDQLQQLVLLANALQHPAIFISKEPGAKNHYICGLVKNNQLLLINPLGITKNSDCYQTLFDLKQEKTISEIWLSSNVLQKHAFEEEGLVSCGPITLELATHILSQFTSETLEKFCLEQLKTNEPTTHEQSGLIYHGVNIAALLPETLKALETAADKIFYRDKACLIREKHFTLLQNLPALRAKEAGVATVDYLKKCNEGAPSQVLINAMVTQHKNIITLNELPEYQLLLKELNQEVISHIPSFNDHPNIARYTHTTSMTRLDEHSQKFCLNPVTIQNTHHFNLVENKCCAEKLNEYFYKFEENFLIQELFKQLKRKYLQPITRKQLLTDTIWEVTDETYCKVQLVEEEKVNLEDNLETKIIQKNKEYETLFDIGGVCLIQGVAGSGKTLLTEYLIQQWAKGHLWKTQNFDIVLRIPLRNLLDRARSKMNLAEVIYSLYFDNQTNNKVQIVELIERFLNDNRYKIGWILDGFDEIATDYQAKDDSNSIKTLLNHLLKQKHVLITTRHEFSFILAAKSTLVNKGFDDATIKQYISNFFNNSTETEAFISWHKQHSSINVLSNPIILELTCNLWHSNKTKATEALATSTDLYSLISSTLLEHHWQHRCSEIHGHPHLQSAIKKCLAQLAYTAIKKGYRGFIPEKLLHLVYYNIVRKHDVCLIELKNNPNIPYTVFTALPNIELGLYDWLKYVENCPLLIQVQRGETVKERAYQFIHLSFQEYWAAEYLSNTINIDIKKTHLPSKAIEKINDMVNDYTETGENEAILVFLAGKLKQELPLLEAYMDIILNESNTVPAKMSTDKTRLLLSMVCWEETQLAPIRQQYAMFGAYKTYYIDLINFNRKNDFVNSSILKLLFVFCGYLNGCPLIKKSLLDLLNSSFSFIKANTERKMHADMRLGTNCRSVPKRQHQLIQQLFNTSDQVNNDILALLLLIGKKTEFAIQSLIKKLKPTSSYSYSEPHEAAKLLLQHGKKNELIQALRENLKAKDAHARQAAAKLLLKHDEEQERELAHKALLENVKTKQAGIRQEAIQLLLDRHEESALFATLKENLKAEDPKIRQEAAKLLLKHDEEQERELVHKTLLENVKTKQADIRQEAIQLLLDRHEESALFAALKENLKAEDPKIRQEAAKLLLKHDEEQERELALKALLENVKTKQADIRQEAIQLLLDRHEESALFAALKENLKAEDPKIRQEAAKLLLKHDEEQEHELALKALLENVKTKQAEIRQEAIQLLLDRHEESELIKALKENLKVEDPEIRQEAAKLLLKHGQEQEHELALKALLENVKAEKTAIRKEAIQLLQHGKINELIQALKENLKAKYSGIRQEAAKLVLQYGDKDEKQLALEILVEDLKNEIWNRQKNVRLILQYGEKIEIATAVQFLMEDMKKESWHRRENAQLIFQYANEDEIAIAIQILLEDMKKESWHRRENAQLIFQYANEDEIAIAIQILLEDMKKESWYCRENAQLFFQYASENQIQLIIQFLKENLKKDSFTCKEAAELLLQHGYKNVLIQSLLENLEDNNLVLSICSAKLLLQHENKNKKQHVVEMLIKLLNDKSSCNRLDLAELLLEHGDENQKKIAICTLAELLENKNSWNRQKATFILAQYCYEEQKHLVIRNLLEFFNSQEKWIRKNSAKLLLSKYDKKEELVHASEKNLNAVDSHIRLEATKFVLMYGGAKQKQRAVRILIEFLDDENPFISLKSIIRLLEHGNEKERKLAINAFLKSYNFEINQKAAQLIFQHCNEKLKQSTIEKLINILERGYHLWDLNKNFTGIHTIFQHGSENQKQLAIKSLTKYLKKITNTVDYQEATKILINYNRINDLTLISVENLKSKDSLLRQEAANLLLEHGNEKQKMLAIKALTKNLKNEKTEIRQEGAKLLLQYGNKNELLQASIENLKSKDSLLRQEAAIFVLQYGNENQKNLATQALIENLKSRNPYTRQTAKHLLSEQGIDTSTIEHYPRNSTINPNIQKEVNFQINSSCFFNNTNNSYENNLPDNANKITVNNNTNLPNLIN